MKLKPLNKLLFIMLANCIFISQLYSQWQKTGIDGNFKKIIAYNNKAIIAGWYGKIFLTTDKGDSWEDISLPGDESVSDGQFLNDSLIYISTNEDIWTSDNSGKDWESKNINDGFFGIHFFNDSIGLLLGSGNIYQVNMNTNELDTTWSEKNVEFVESGGIHHIIFLNDSVGFAIGSVFKRIDGWLNIFGIIIKTENSGKEWATIYDSDSITFMNNSNMFIKNNILYVCENLNIIYTDINKTLPEWNYFSIPYFLASPETAAKNSITSMFFTTQDTGYITISPTAILMPAEGNGYDLILKTFDGGLSWSRQFIDTFDLETTYANPSLSNILFFNDSTGIACGYNKIFKTSNSGGGILFIEHETNNNFPVNIYQNNYQLTVKFNYIPDKFQLSIYDLNGRIILRLFEDGPAFTEYTYNLNPIDDGIYIAEVIFNKTKKISKEILLARNR